MSKQVKASYCLERGTQLFCRCGERIAYLENYEAIEGLEPSHKKRFFWLLSVGMNIGRSMGKKAELLPRNVWIIRECLESFYSTEVQERSRELGAADDKEYPEDQLDHRRATKYCPIVLKLRHMRYGDGTFKKPMECGFGSEHNVWGHCPRCANFYTFTSEDREQTLLNWLEIIESRENQRKKVDIYP